MMPYKRRSSLIDAHVARSKNRTRDRALVAAALCLIILTAVNYSLQGQYRYVISAAEPLKPMMKIDPADGKAYEKDSFVQVYGGTVEWDAAKPAPGYEPPPPPPPPGPPPAIDRNHELRIDPSDGKAYDKTSFLDVYGSTKEWDAAVRAPGSLRDHSRAINTAGKGHADGFNLEAFIAKSTASTPAASRQPPPADPIGGKTGLEWSRAQTTVHAGGQSKGAKSGPEGELRIDDADGMAYDINSFKEVYGDEWQAKWEASSPERTEAPPPPPPPAPPPPSPPPPPSLPEMRIDASDGNAYDKQSFIDVYGGTKEWDAAKKAPSEQGASQPPPPQLDTATAVMNSQLMRMAMKGDVAQVEELLGSGANPDQQNKYGFSALMFAAWQGHTEVVKLLLDAGADLHLRNKKNKSAHDLALMAKKPALAQLLEDALR